MANHGYVKTSKPVNPQNITDLLEELNNSLFKNNLNIEYHKSTKENPGWGRHSWLLTYISNNQTWAQRVCWMNNKKNFVMRHGGGENFAWWIDTVILNEIAFRYEGTIKDDGDSSASKGDPLKYNNFNNYLDLLFSKCKPELKKSLLELERIPPEFRQ